MSKLIYLDNAATTKTAPEVLEAMPAIFYRAVWQSFCDLQLRIP